MRLFFAMLLLFSVSSCWIKERPGNPVNSYQRVWGNKPIYETTEQAKKISFSNTALAVSNPGNIYAKGNFLYQLEIGKGIHVIDNSIPAQAARIGFITVNGSSQISIKNNLLYTNSYDDLLVIDITDLNNIVEVKRVAGAFPDGRNSYYFIEPVESGYYECPRYDSVVIGWVKDSIWSACYKN